MNQSSIIIEGAGEWSDIISGNYTQLPSLHNGHVSYKRANLENAPPHFLWFDRQDEAWKITDSVGGGSVFAVLPYAGRTPGTGVIFGAFNVYFMFVINFNGKVAYLFIYVISVINFISIHS